MKYCASCQTSYPADYTACPKDQTPLQLVTDLRPGLVLRGKYEIIEKLGQGGMGAVYKARHVAFDELRAIKFVSSHLLEDERALARFRAEAVVARRLQHPNAVKVEDLDTTEDGRSFIVMEFIEGRSLRQLFTSDHDVTTKRVLSLARHACGALGAAHALGIVHRDIKPDNLMIVTGADGTESLKVADFGLAKVRAGFDGKGDSLTQTGSILGTPPYMSPEQASGLDVDGRSDLYSLGIVIYEFVTGRLPFRSDSPIGMLIHHRETPPEAPAGLGVPKPLADFLVKALAKRREDRFQTAEQMDEGLRLLTLMPLPEFVGQGIRDGFEPTWAGSRHASRVTTLDAPAAAPKIPVAARPEARSSESRGARPGPLPAAPPRIIVRPTEKEAPETSPSRFWLWIGAAVLIVGGFVWTRGNPDTPRPATTAAAPTVEAPSQASAPGDPAHGAERTDTAIRFDIERLLGDSTALRTSHIQAEVANGVVTLVGDVPDETAAQLAASLASTVPGVRRVFSTLQGAPALQTGVAPAPAPESAPRPAAVTAPAEPVRPAAPAAEETQREQVRALLERAREKIEARNPEAAEADLIAALKLDPTNAVAKEVLERLRNRPKPPNGPLPPGVRPTPF